MPLVPSATYRNFCLGSRENIVDQTVPLPSVVLGEIRNSFTNLPSFVKI